MLKRSRKKAGYKKYKRIKSTKQKCRYGGGENNISNENRIRDELLYEYSQNSPADCGLFKKLNVKKYKKDLLKLYLQKKNGMKLYYNQYLQCLDKDLTLYNAEVENPQLSTNNNKKLEIMKYNRLITKIRKKIREICVYKEPVFCQENTRDIYTAGVSVCQENRMCEQSRSSIRNIPRDAKLIFSDVTKSLLEPLFPSRYVDDDESTE